MVFHVLGISPEMLECIEKNQIYRFSFFKMFKINIRKKIY